jgi:hypothetical protein
MLELNIVELFVICSFVTPGMYRNQCCGSGSVSVGSVCFWVSRIRIRIRKSQVWIRLRI